MEKVNANDIMRKFKSKEDRINFAREVGYVLPEKPGFYVKFFLQFLKGEKKLLQLGASSGYDFKYFTRSNTFTKNHLLQILAKDAELMKYLPDDLNPMSIEREYLFSILAIEKKEIYLQLYNHYKEILQEREVKKWSGYEITVSSEIKNKIAAFTNVASQNGAKPFRLTKNGNVVNVFQKKNSKDVVEKTIPKGKINDDSIDIDNPNNL